MVRNDAKWEETCNLDYLLSIDNPSLGDKHYPLNHGEVLETFRLRLRTKGVKIVKELGMLNEDQTRYIYTAELAPILGVAYTIGFVNYNDKTKSFTGIAGEKVMVCSNQMITGQVVESKRKHTKYANSELVEKCDIIIDHFIKFKDKRQATINNMKKNHITDAMLGRYILKVHRNTTIAGSTIDQVIREYDAPTYSYGTDGDTLWDLQNAFTTVFKKYKNPLHYIKHCTELNAVLQGGAF